MMQSQAVPKRATFEIQKESLSLFADIVNKSTYRDSRLETR